MYCAWWALEEGCLDWDLLLEGEELGLKWEPGEMDADCGSEGWVRSGGGLNLEEGEGNDGAWGDGGEDLECDGMGELWSGSGGGGEKDGAGRDDSGVGGGDDLEGGGGETFDGGGEESGGGASGGVCAWGGGGDGEGGGEREGKGGGGEWCGGDEGGGGGGGGDFDGAFSGGFELADGGLDGGGAETFWEAMFSETFFPEPSSEIISDGFSVLEEDVPFDSLLSLAISEFIKNLNLIYSQKWLEKWKTKTKERQWQPTTILNAYPICIETEDVLFYDLIIKSEKQTKTM